MQIWTDPPASAGNGPVAEQRRSLLPRDAALFRRWIEDQTAGRERAVDYFAAARADSGVGRPFKVYRTGAPGYWCPEGFANLRWRRFDRGEPVEFTLSNVEGAGPASESLRVAMDAWNQVPGGRIQLAADEEG